MIIATFKHNKKITKTVMVLVIKLWLRGIDSNYRPSGYEPDELPTAPPRDVLTDVIIIPLFVNVNTFLSLIPYYMHFFI